VFDGSVDDTLADGLHDRPRVSLAIQFAEGAPGLRVVFREVLAEATESLTDG
jgi:hypothetical protein